MKICFQVKGEGRKVKGQGRKVKGEKNILRRLFTFHLLPFTLDLSPFTFRLLPLPLCLLPFTFVVGQTPDYRVVWHTPSANSSESMPCGGGGVGLNVWVENGDILFYISQSGTFDENNTLLKQGRIRIRLSPNPLEGEMFRQELNPEEGCVYISAKNKDLSTTVRIWADVFHPVVNVEVSNTKKLTATILYENWRYEDRPLRKNESNQNSYKWAPPENLLVKKDSITFEEKRIVFYHKNEGETIFDVAVKQQGLGAVKADLYDPLKNRISGGIIEAKGFAPAGTVFGKYQHTPYKAWKLETIRPMKKWNLNIRLQSLQTENVNDWKRKPDEWPLSDRAKNLLWWKDFRNRSFIHIRSADGQGEELSRNYCLFRYMLACNAFGDYPTKFNGGLFTFDPFEVDSLYPFTPDFRKWGGGTYTAQNQRLVYFPMLKSGDFDLMKPQFDFYLRNLSNAELRSRIYWNHAGACFTEQIENYGLPNPSEYGWNRPEQYDKGLEYNAWLEYQWDTVLEFCLMIVETERYAGNDISIYLPLIESCLRFFDEHYRYLAMQRGSKSLDANGRLILYPGSACETYKMAYNATSTIAALQTTLSHLLKLPANYLDVDRKIYYEQFLSRLPEIRLREINGHTLIAPAWQWERINNTESPQLYPVFPWGIYGIGKPGLEEAINTYLYDPDVIRFRDYKGWKQDAIWAARLGLTGEAKKLTIQKLRDSALRFPAFWGPGFDWTPDHNWGGSGMIALQEMLLQSDGEKIFLLPAWPSEWDVHFKLHAPNKKVVECKWVNGEMKEVKVNGEKKNYKNLLIVD
jgi:hypothetical protein